MAGIRRGRPRVAGIRLRGLYAVTPEGLPTAELLAHVRAALAGGTALLQYRSKSPDPGLRRHEAGAVAALCREFAVPLIVNDDLELALAVEAAGVHLGRDDGDWAAARRRLGPQRLLGVSCYNELQRAAQGAAAGADYLAFGSMYPSATKPAAVRAPFSLLAEAKTRFGLPLAAIGGITAERAPELIAHGADLLAVVSDLFDAPDVAARAAAYAALFQRVDSMPPTSLTRPP